MKKTTKIGGVIVGTAALVVAGSGAAFAYWTAQAAGTGSAGTGSDVRWTVATDAATGAALVPGGAAQQVTVRVTNGGSGVQRLAGVQVAVAKSDGTAWTSGTCSAADYSVTVLPVSGDVQPGAQKTTTASVSMVNRDANQDDCKGVTVPLYVTAS